MLLQMRCTRLMHFAVAMILRTKFVQYFDIALFWCYVEHVQK
jgi:hypothetical protein